MNEFSIKYDFSGSSLVWTGAFCISHHSLVHAGKAFIGVGLLTARTETTGWIRFPATYRLVDLDTLIGGLFAGATGHIAVQGTLGLNLAATSAAIEERLGCRIAFKLHPLTLGRIFT